MRSSLFGKDTKSRSKGRTVPVFYSLLTSSDVPQKPLMNARREFSE